MSLLTPSQKIKILLLSATPDNVNPLKVDSEFNKIKKSLNYIKNIDLYEIFQEGSVSVDDFSASIDSFKPRIIHFSGHGDSEGIYVENSNGHKELLSNESLIKSFDRYSDFLECVIFNSCFSEEQAKLVSETVSVVIGTSNKVKDESAIIFSESFYRFLHEGYTYEQSFGLAVAEVGEEHYSDAEVPVLFLNGHRMKYSSLTRDKKLKRKYERRFSYKLVKYFVYTNFALLLYLFINYSLFFDNLSEDFRSIISMLVLLFTILGVGSVERVSPKVRSLINIVVRFFYYNRIFIYFSLFLFLPVLYFSLNINYCHFKKYNYKINLTKLAETIRVVENESEIKETIRKLVWSFPKRKEAYALLAWKSQYLRNNFEDDRFRVFNKIIIEGVYGEFLTVSTDESNYEFGYIENSSMFCQCSLNNDINFNPLLFLARIYAETSKGVIDKGDVDKVVGKIISYSPAGPERRLYKLVKGSEELQKYGPNELKNKILNIKNEVLDVLKKSLSQDVIESDIAQQSWDHLAQLEIILCYADPNNKKFHIENISKYYSSLLNIRKKSLNINNGELVWFFPPEKFTLYWHISKWNAGNVNNIPVNIVKSSLEAWLNLCPGYEEILKKTINKYPSFVSNNYEESWIKGTLAKHNVNPESSDFVINNMISKNWRW